GEPAALALSPDGRYVALASTWFGGHRDRWDNLIVPEGEKRSPIRLLDMDDGKVIQTLDGGHIGNVSRLTFSPDGTILASGSEDTTVLLWDVSQRSEVRGQRSETELRPKELVALWDDLKGHARKAQRSIVALTAAPAQAVPFLKSRLHRVEGAD